MPLGFQRYKNRFWRVVNDVYQSLWFGMSKYYCWAYFRVQPFCMDLCRETLLEADCDPHSLKLLSLTDVDWGLKNQHPDTITTTVDSIVSVVQTRLIPAFERATDCNGAYEELRKLYQFGQDAERPALKWRHEHFYMLLKLGRLDEARRLQLMFREHMEAIGQEGWTMEVEFFGEEVARQRQATRLAPIDADIELTKHPEQVRQLIAENERKSRISFGLE